MLNRAQIIGHLGGDPEIKSTQSGNQYANFSVATTEKWRDKQSGDRRERTEWHRVTCWNEHLVKIIQQYVFKGSKVFIEGKLQTRKWEKDGQDHYSTEIIMQGFDAKLIMLDSKKDNEGRQSSGQDSGPGDPPGGDMDAGFDDEIPF